MVIRRTDLGDTVTTTFEDVGKEGFVENVTIETLGANELDTGQRRRLKILREWEEDVDFLTGEHKKPT